MVLVCLPVDAHLRYTNPGFKLHVETGYLGSAKGERFCVHGDGLPPRILQFGVDGIPQMLRIGHRQVDGEDANAALRWVDTKTGIDNHLPEEVVKLPAYARSP